MRRGTRRHIGKQHGRGTGFGFGGVGAKAAQPEAARQLLAFMLAPGNRAVYVKMGLEPQSK